MVIVGVWVDVHVTGMVAGVNRFSVVGLLCTNYIEVAVVRDNFERISRLPRVNLYQFEHLEPVGQPRRRG